MKIKKYIAPTMPEAMKQIRKDLGPGAVILNSKEVQQGGFFGFFKKKQIEVVAALDPEPIQLKSNKKASVNIKPVNNNTISHGNDQVLREIKQLKKLIEKQSDTAKSYPVNYQLVYQHLLNHEVNQELAREIIDSVIRMHEDKDDSLNTSEVIQDAQLMIERRLSEFSFSGITTDKKIVQFVGPTGVGKTTTIAKVAANMMLKDKKKLAFITMDTYRIAAVEQLKTYARILNVPLEVAYSIEDYKNAIDKFKAFDMILVDTAGRNFREEKYIKELTNTMDQSMKFNTYLVLSLTAKPKDILEIYEQFHHIPIEKVIFTKLDETRQYGSILNIVLEKKIGIAYITNGQDVPSDIVQVTPEKISNLIVGDFGET